MKSASPIIRGIGMGAIALCSTLMFASPSVAQENGDAAAGKSSFQRRCQMCHSTTPGQMSLGPSLAGVVGRKPGSLPKFGYSNAIRNIKTAWTPSQIDQFLQGTTKFAPGTRMAITVPTPAERANIIAYLKTLKN